MFDTLEILCTHFSYNKKLKEEKQFFNVVADIQRVLKILKIRKLHLKGKSLSCFPIKSCFPIIYKNCSEIYCQ